MTQQKRHLRTMCVPTPPPPKQTQNKTSKPTYALFLHYFSVPSSCLKGVYILCLYQESAPSLPLFLPLSLSTSLSHIAWPLIII